MLFSIIVPHYDESIEVVSKLLISIQQQQGFNLENVEVILVHDGLTKEPISFPFSFTFSIRQFCIPHGGVSAARQYGLDHALGDYVMFCDADDMFYTVTALWAIEQECIYGFDVLVSAFVEQGRTAEGQYYLTLHEQDGIFVHGKVFRRQFLIDQHISWDSSLTIHEDSYFNILAQRISTNTKYTSTPFYLWCWRSDSVCRRDFQYILKTYNNMLDSSTALIEQFLMRKRYQDAQCAAAMMTYDAYFTMNKAEWIHQDNKQYRDSTEQRFATYYRKYRTMIEAIPEHQKTNIVASARQRFYTEGMVFEAITYKTWIDHIMTL